MTSLRSIDFGMNDTAMQIETTEDELVVRLADGRSISTPLAWYPRLLHASVAQRRHWRLIGAGEGIHWPDLDEDLSVAGLLRGEVAVHKGF